MLIQRSEKICHLPMSLGCQKTLELIDSTFVGFFKTPCGIRSLKELIACQGSLIKTHEVKKLYALIMGEKEPFPDHELTSLLSHIYQMEQDLRENMKYIKCDK